MELKTELENLGREMIQEIKNAKDLTKETLPQVAKEYVRFNTAIYLYSVMVFGLVTLVSAIAAVYGIANEGWTRKSSDVATFCFGGGLFMAVIFGGITAGNFVGYLSYKMQPRLKAIEGVMKAFKGRA